MAHTILEARAVISAEDRTAAAFAAIEGRINRLSHAAKEVGKVSNSVARATAGIGTQASAIATASRNVGRHIGAGFAIAAPIIDHQVAHFAKAVAHTYREFDKERRYAKAVMGLTDEQQEPLVKQAIHGGASSKYNDIQWLEAQRELSARGLNVDQVRALTEIAATVGQAMDKSLPDSVKALEGAMFGFGKDISTYDRAVANARRTADLQVKASKISGMNYDDLVQAYKFGAAPFHLGGLSEAQLLAFSAVGKRANMGGDEMGVAARALVASLVKPTAGARTALLSRGIDFSKYQTLREQPMNVDNFAKSVAQTYGVELDKGAKGALKKIFDNKSITADASKFMPKVMSVLGDHLGGDDAKSKKSIAGEARRYRDASMAGVDLPRLFNDVMKAMAGNVQLANAIFGSKQGGRIATALGEPETFRHRLDDLENHSQGYAEQISKERTAGFDGAISRFENAVKNLETALGRVADNKGKGGPLTKATDWAGRKVQELAESDDDTLKKVAAAGVAATAYTTFEGLVKGASILNRLAGGGGGALEAFANNTMGRMAFLGRMGIYGGAAYAGYRIGEAGAGAFDDVARGKYWTPKDSEELSDAKGQLAEIEGKIKQISETSKNIDARDMLLRPLQDQAAELRNRIAAGERTSAQVERTAPPAQGAAQGGTAENIAAALNGKITADVTGKVGVEGQAQVNVQVTVTPSSELINAVGQAKAATMQLRNSGGGGSGTSDKGVSMPEASPGGKMGTAE